MLTCSFSPGDRSLLFPLLFAISVIAGTSFHTVHAQSQNSGINFVPIGADLTGVKRGSSDWGDYDRDGDLDLVITGEDENGNRSARVYEYKGENKFSDIESGLEGVQNSSSDWGDYNNDGYEDIVITGRNGSFSNTSIVYKNESGSLEDSGISVANNTQGSSEWGDFNEDGKLDLVITGDYSNNKTAIYKNTSEGFVRIDEGVTQVGTSSSDWGDYDGDGDLDLVISGSNGFYSRVTEVYEYEKGSFEKISQNFKGVNYGSTEWCDYNNDGKLDLIVTGYKSVGSQISRLYKNEGNNNFKSVENPFPAVGNSAVACGDFDGDGYEDVLISGNSNNGKEAKVYRNKSGDGFELVFDLEGVNTSSADWGDYDSDGDIDLVITGTDESGNTVSRVYENRETGEGPSPPSDLQASVVDGQISLTWDSGGNGNPDGYNIYRSTSPFTDIASATKLNESLEPDANYPDSDVESGTEYFYRVTAVDEEGTQSIPSNQASATGPSPFASWPQLDDPSITLKVVHPTAVGVSKVSLPVRSENTFKQGSNPAGANSKASAELTSEPASSRTEDGKRISFFKFEESAIRDALKGIADPGAQIFQIRLLDDESKVVGYLPFRYKQSADFEDGRYGIDAIVYLHNEEALQPEQRFWSSRWRYYDDFPEARPLSMLVPPKGNVDSVESDQEDPVVLVHGVSGRYPSWGNDIKKARSLVKHLSSKGYDGWQFFYPENQDITKSGPLLAKAIYRLRSDLGYDSDQKFDLVAHSMGGLVSRHYVQTMGIGPLRTPYSQVVDNLPDPDSAIEKFLMLGTPNHGSLGSFKCTGGNLNTCDFLKDYLEKDPGAPAYVQMTPGSRFLSDLNRSDEAPESYSPSSTLVLAGTRNPSFDVGVTLSVEIPEQDDGVVAVSSASMLDLGVPLATGDFTHSAGLDVDGLGDPRLNEDTDAIITNFLSDAYDPTVPANLGNITGFWGENKAGSTDPEPTYENGLSADTDKGILTINTDGITITELGIKWPCLPDGFGTDPEVCVRIGSEAGMEKVPRQSRFFSRSVALSVGEGYAPTIASGIAAKTNRTAVIQEEHLGGTWKKIGTMPLTTKNLHTTQNTLSLDDQQQAIVEAGSTTPSVGGSISAKNGSATSSRSLAPKDAQTTSTEFQVSAATDTLSFWLAQDSTGDFSSHNMRLVTPGGSVIDSSEAKSEPEFGYSQDLGLGYAIYLVTDPTPGRWTVRYDGSVNASVSAPVKGAIDLQASMPDSVYTTEETVPVSVSVSDQNSYQSVEVSAQLRIEDAEDGDIKTLGSVDLSKSGATTYEGEFSPSYVGSHQVSVDFSATVEGESVLRRTVETVEVIGDSMDTPPDPLPAPTNLSAQIEEDVVVSWSAPSTGSVDEYRIYRDTIPNPTQRVGKVSAGQTSYTDTGVQNRQTYYYRITAVGTNGVESDFTEEVSIFSYPSSLSVNVQRTFGDPSGEQGYRLVALPGAVEEPLDAVTGGEAGADWQAFWDDGSSQDYFRKYDGSDTFSFRPGRGFWVLKRSGWSVQRSIETVSLSGRSQTTIPLHEGWNIISNPFGGDLSWAQVDAANSDSLRALWRFDGSFAQADTFRSAKTGEAFYFLNDTGLDSLSVPYPSGPSIRAKQKEKSSLLSISARPEGLESPASTVKIGFDEEAAGGLGRLDQPAPPGQFSAISLRLKASGDVPDRQRWLAAEKRPPSTEVNGGGYTFDLRLRSQVEGPVRISASGLKAVEDKEVELLHPSTGESYDLKSGEPVTLQETDSTALRLAVGTAAYVQDQADKVVPDEVTLTSYPNPMSRQATLEYTLPEAKEVRLAVYDVLGRRVATLKQGRMEAGRHRARLQGDQLSSGVYFGRLKVGDQTRTQKITVVR